MIEACQEIADFDRAARWTAALTTWCAEQPGLVPFTGQCAVHRGQIMRAQGAFGEALIEFDLAVHRYLAEQAPGPAGLAMAERGDVLRIRGDLTEAQATYERAVEFGHEPQPGLVLLWLSHGRTEAAAAAIRRLLGEADDSVRRSQLLPAAVEVLLAAGRARSRHADQPRIPQRLTAREVEVLRYVAAERPTPRSPLSSSSAKDRRPSPEQHLHQARGHLPNGGGRIRLPTPHHLTRANSAASATSARSRTWTRGSRTAWSASRWCASVPIRSAIRRCSSR